MPQRILFLLLILCPPGAFATALERDVLPAQINRDDIIRLKKIKSALPELWGAYPSSSDFHKIGQEILHTVRDKFYDPERAAQWSGQHENYGAGVKDSREFSKTTNELLAELKVSHTRYYAPDVPEYYMLLAIFQSAFKIDSVELDGIGADIARWPEGFFVAGTFFAGPAEKAGLKRGDKIVQADGKPFDPYLSFKGQAGRRVALAVIRKDGGPAITIAVIPRRINPKQEWLESQRLGSRVIEHKGKKIAYANLWSCAGEEHQQALQDAIIDSFPQADALIIDFRNGWGGCNPEFLNLFNPYIPVFTGIDHRAGKTETTDTQWRKPLFFLINGGTRSGKEVVAFAVKKHKIGTLIGERTAGAVMAGQAFFLSDGSLLYLAVHDGLLDGQRLEGVGVEPDVFVPADLPFAAGKDPQFEEALDLAASMGKYLKKTLK